MTSSTALLQFGLALVNRLAAASAAGEVEWRVDGPTRVVANFETFRMALHRGDERLLILDAHGAEALAFTPDMLAADDAAERRRVAALFASLAASVLDLAESPVVAAEPMAHRVLARRPPKTEPPPSPPATPPPSRRAKGGSPFVPRALTQGLCRHSWAASRSQPGTEVCHRCKLRRSGLIHVN